MKMKRSSSVSSDEDNYETKMNKISVEELKHKCNICGKAYSNGKALGGHRRSHFIKKKTNHHSQKVKTPLSIQVSNNFCDEKKKFSCYICDRKFWTNNALYGHMRSHPDRVFKGVSPPSSNNSNSSTRQNKEDEDDEGDDDCSLPRWQKRDKRGRKCIGSAEAAANLLLLRSDKCYSILSSDELKTPEFFISRRKEDFHMSSDELKTPKFSVDQHGMKMKKIKIFIGSSSMIGNKSIENDNEIDEAGDLKLKKGKSLSQSNVEEKEINPHEEQHILDFDLNEPYVMEEE
ncbi:unnamed protein product [Lathyrus sativus]|nr:unnamed protein product [Lathyrus sativus]